MTKSWVDRLLRGDGDGSGCGGRPRGSDGTYFGGPAALKPLNETNVGLLKSYLEQQDSKYSESHYTRVAESCGYSLIALSAGRPVGCICCSLEEDSAASVQTPFTPLQTIWRQSQGKTEAQPQKKLVKIMLLQVSTEDRCRGIGTNMLRNVIRAAKADSFISRLALDVHAENEGAIRLYRRFGFRITGSKQNYSKSWIMELSLGDVVEETVEKTTTTATTVENYPQTTSSSTPKEQKLTMRLKQQKEEEIKAEDKAERWRRSLEKEAAEKWKNQMEAEKERGGRGGRGEKKEARDKNPSGERKDSSIVRRSNITHPTEQKVSGSKTSDVAAVNTKDAAQGSVELLDQITKRAKERAEKMARILQITPPVNIESKQRQTGNGGRIKAGFESSVQERDGSGVGQIVGIGSQSSSINHEDVMVRLRKKATEISAGGRPGLRNPSHRWTAYSVSNWREG